MKTGSLFLTIFMTLVGLSLPLGARTASSTPLQTPGEDIFDLTTFGAVGDGVTDDGPALQSALNAVAQAGGGALCVPAGRYAIITPVLKNFSGGSSLTILGVASLTPVNTQGTAGGSTRGLDLTSELVIRTGAATTALSLRGLKSLVIS
ncbi:MAG: glycosyl hydrolase family 28-related protein, partial [Thermoanaerobaculia bacterium]